MELGLAHSPECTSGKSLRLDDWDFVTRLICFVFPVGSSTYVFYNGSRYTLPLFPNVTTLPPLLRFQYVPHRHEYLH